MTELQLKCEICKAAAALTTACIDTRGMSTQRIMDGKLSQEEKLANLEVWETFKVLCAGIAASLKPENNRALGFENLSGLIGGSKLPIPETIVPAPGPTS